MDPKIDWSTTRSLKIVSLVLSAVGLLAGSLSMYWLVRMRRSFRHDLILLLIASDIAKSSSFVVYSSTTLNRPLQAEPGSKLCQVSGFFLAMAIEASDVAVFLIALHWSVYIFRSNRTAGKSGIYPYRYLAFAFYVVFPATMASLAFFTKAPAYTDTGQYCYLPTSPWWKRMSLSWIPRYVNMAAIVGMYCASYVYVRITVRRFGKQQGSVPTGHKERQIPDTPPIVSHGLIPSPLESRRVSFRVTTGGSSYQEQSSIQADAVVGFRDSLRSRLDQVSVSSKRSRGWPWHGLDWDAEAGAHSPTSGLVSPRTVAADPVTGYTETAFRVQPPLPSMSTLRMEEEVETPPSTLSASRYRNSSVFYRRPLSTTMEADEGSKGARIDVNRSRHLKSSQMHIYTALQQGPHTDSEGGPKSATPVASLDYETFGPDGVSRGRDRIRRQLSLLFVYPAVYACVWVFPLVNDVIALDTDDSRKPIWVMVASLVSLCVQGLADTMLFCVREKPWRHIKGGFWENLGIFMSGISFETRNESGRTREEMFHDGSRARLRREEEIEREQRAGRMSRMSQGCTSEASVYRHWWDTELHGDEKADDQDERGKDEEWQLSGRRGDWGSTQTG